MRGFHSCDYYGMGMMPAGREGMVGFLWKYWHELPYVNAFGNQKIALYGRSDIGLVYQPEAGGRWLHMPGRANFIESASLQWTSGWINSSSNVVETGNEQRLYFSGRSYSHGFSKDENWQSIPHLRKYMKKHPLSGITFASWPKWRIFGFEADPEGSFTIRLGRISKPSSIALNYETIKPEGCIRASVQTDEGDIIKQDKEVTAHALKDSIPLTGDNLNRTLSWKDGEIIPPTSSATLTLHLKNVRVYAYEIRGKGKAI